MKKITRRLIIAQGYEEQVVDSNPQIISLSKWTPFACAFLGSIGAVIQSSTYFIVLGLLTFIGAIANRSLYDYIYKYFISHLYNLGEMPLHGAPRRLGCGIGAFMFIMSGIGFYLNNLIVGYFFCLFMIVFALIAGFFNWCFVSTIYGLFSKQKQQCCIN